MAEWIAEGEPSLDLWHMDVRRFGAQYRSPAYTHARIKETYETYYDIRYPNHEREAGRPLRVSPANAWHREHGAAFGEKSGWERVNWYESNAAAGDESLRPRGWAGQHWSPGDRRRAPPPPASRPAIFDESSFAKIEIAGPGAAAFLERLCDNRVARDVGQITYTQMLNRRGGIECDFTVARLAEERFSIVTGHRLRQPRPRVDPPPPARATAASQVARRDLAVGLLRDLGPARARHPRAAHAAGPLRTRPSRTCRVREITVGDVPVRALRVTYVGELGWELYCPTEYGLGLWRRAVGGRRAARHGRRRLPRDRLDAPREGLPRLGRRHHPRRDAVRGRRRLLRQARQGGRLHRPRRARRGEGARPADAALPASCSTTRARSRSATSRCGSRARSAAG